MVRTPSAPDALENSLLFKVALSEGQGPRCLDGVIEKSDAHFTGGKTEAQSGNVTCSRSQRRHLMIWVPRCPGPMVLTT